MIVTWLGHAGLFLNAGGKTLLIDPWFSEPVFGGAWFRYPPPPYPDASLLPKPDFLLLSHIHPDHSGPGTLAQLKPDTKTFAMTFPSGALQRRLNKLRFSRVQWLGAWETVQLEPGLTVTFVGHDRGWEVSSIIVEADGVRLYHGNDNPLSVDAYKEIVRRLGKIDIAFLPYAGASSYPTGFGGRPEVMKERCEKKKKEGLARFTDGIVGLQPAEAVPFASSWALLELSEVEKNFVDRPTSDEALAHAMKLAHENGTHLLRMMPGDEWSPDTGVLEKDLCEGWTQDVEAVREYAEHEQVRVMREISAARHLSAKVDPKQLDEAMHLYCAEMIKAAGDSISNLDMKAGFVGEGGGEWSLRFTPGAPPEVKTGLVGDEDETLMVAAAELWSLVAGPSNWEDVWYGYRLRVKKREGAGYYRAFWEMLLNFDDVPTSERLAEKFGLHDE